MKAAVYVLTAAILIVGGLLFYEQHQSLVVAQQQASIAQQQEARVQLQLAAVKAQKPPMPIKMLAKKIKLRFHFRLSLAVVFQNTSNNKLDTVVTIINPYTLARKAFTLNFGPYGTIQIDEKHGWNFHIGDQIYLQSNDYANKDGVVPNINPKISAGTLIELFHIATKVAAIL